ncbi:flavin monoamine oxidase family protein [Beijerinckia indica]|uniref:Tryptophan 2-monooxygenase n=1 Tax=Beijerinckia indica subsp. indica (strain ATCC 9039 / DSM 1715 / NCIMB 8712) TaxID=395963 RepID=B2IC40_BEII9|nr:NAD(P)/FAD-dependent oxidoreductase [Beijerinckia indica]ACB95295.1 amine oxidase [Beijerinckia indica subsp. indica ATCC 9039]
MPLHESQSFDVIIIGAGAAGLGAALQLALTPIRFCLLEARDRIGGRAHTLTQGLYPLDLGCGWLHSADHNPLVSILEQRGFTLDRTLPAWGTQTFDLGFSAADQQEFQAAADRLQARFDSFDPDASDVASSTLLEAGSRWNPLLDAISTYMSGAELDRVSARDNRNYHDTHLNWRIREGYGQAIGSLGQGLPIRLDCPVTAIDHSGPLVRVETAHGSLTTAKVIITLPTSLLAKESIRFTPALPDKREAAAGLPLGLADKVLLGLDDANDWPADGHFFGSITQTMTGSYHLRPFGRPLIEGYFGGQLAGDLEAAGPGAFFDFAVAELSMLLGSDMRHRLHFVVETRWGQDPFAHGAYSYALPGHAGARARLAALVDQRLFFAGEACSPHAFSTAHGAFMTGEEAALQALAALGTSVFAKARE